MNQLTNGAVLFYLNNTNYCSCFQRSRKTGSSESQYFAIILRDKKRDGVIVRESLKHQGNPILLYLRSNLLHFLWATSMWHAVGNDQSSKVQNINLLSSYFDQMSPLHSAIYNGPKFSVNRQPPVRGGPWVQARLMDKLRIDPTFFSKCS